VLKYRMYLNLKEAEKADRPNGKCRHKRLECKLPVRQVQHDTELQESGS
jgi:hypothetical protein